MNRSCYYCVTFYITLCFMGYLSYSIMREWWSLLLERLEDRQTRLIRWTARKATQLGPFRAICTKALHDGSDQHMPVLNNNNNNNQHIIDSNQIRRHSLPLHLSQCFIFFLYFSWNCPKKNNLIKGSYALDIASEIV